MRVRRISPMMSFFKRRASRRDEQRLMLRKKDSNLRMSVRIVMVSVVGGTWGWAEVWRLEDRGDCASNIFRTLVISFLEKCG